MGSARGNEQQADEIEQRDPRTDPVCGDVVEDDSGERRSVEKRARGAADTVHYRCAGGVALDDPRALRECAISAWRCWADGAEILHAAHKPFEPPAARKARLRALSQHARAAGPR
jgi:hypothetical protein